MRLRGVEGSDYGVRSVLRALIRRTLRDGHSDALGAANEFPPAPLAGRTDGRKRLPTT